MAFILVTATKLRAALRLVRVAASKLVATGTVLTRFAATVLLRQVRFVALAFWRAVTLASLVFQPALYLLPWLLGVGGFALFLDSGQGSALIDAFPSHDDWSGTVALGMFVTWLIGASGSLLAVVASATKEGRDAAPLRFRCAVAGAWIMLISIVPLALFTKAAGVTSGWLLLALLTFASIAATVWLVLHVDKPDSMARRTLRLVYGHRLLFAVFALLLAIAPLVAGALIAIAAPAHLADVGSLLLCMIGIAANAGLFGVALVVVPLGLRLPWIGALFVLVMVTWSVRQPYQVDRENPLLREASARAESSMRQLADSCRRTPNSLFEALEQHTHNPRAAFKEFVSGKERDRTIRLISADGGGIRAAYWTAVNLAQQDLVTDGRFSEEIASLSGVSGGSLGIAAWLAARERQDLDAHERMALLDRFLTSDFLSALAGGLLFLDVPRVALGPLWFTATRDQVFERALVDRWQEVGSTDFFARPFMRLCIKGLRAAPAIFFNATDALTGAYVPLSTASLGPYADADTVQRTVESLNNTSLADATVAQIVHMSARFAYLSPAAQVGMDPRVLARETALAMHGQSNERAAKDVEEKVSRLEVWRRIWVLVDGGYVDNSGLSPTNAALRWVLAERENEAKADARQPRPFERTAIKVLHLSNDPGNACLPLPPGWRDRLTERARHHLSIVPVVPRCYSQLLNLEESLSAQPFQWLLVPVQALDAVRAEQSRRVYQQLVIKIKNEKNADIQLLSLSQTLSDAYGESTLADALVKGGKGIMEEVVKEQASTVESLVAAGTVTREVADNHLKDLSQWAAELRRYYARWTCHKEHLPKAPPLGWTLDRNSQQLMKCMMERLWVRQGVFPPVPEIPGTTGGDCPAPPAMR